MPMLRNRSTLLYPVPPGAAELGRRPPDDTLGDLNLDQVFAAIGAGCEEYRFEEFFACPSADLDVIGHRHAVFADLEDAATAELIRSFVLTVTHFADVAVIDVAGVWGMRRPRPEISDGALLVVVTASSAR